MRISAIAYLSFIAAHFFQLPSFFSHFLLIAGWTACSCISGQPVYAVVDKDFFIGAVGLGFHFQAGQIGHSVANGSPLLQ